MKTLPAILAASLFVNGAVFAQLNSRLAGPPTEIGLNHRAWIYDAEDAPQTPGQPSRRARVIELNTGVHYWDSSANTLKTSEPSFIESEQGFTADRVQAKVHLRRDLYSAGSVTVSGPDGTVLSSTPMAICIADRVTGAFTIVGTLTNCEGIMISSNQVLYQNAFSGICADLMYTVTQDSVEQDVLFTAFLDSRAYGYPRETACLKILTEFYQTDTPERLRQPVYIEGDAAVRRRRADPDIYDETLSFGNDLIISSGHAYSTPSLLETNGVQAVVSKEYQIIEQRAFLIETIEVWRIARGLLSLPPCVPPGGEGAMKRTPTKSYAAIPRLPLKPQASKPSLGTKRLAKAELDRRPALVADYRMTLSGGSFVARGDSTILVSSAASCSQLVLEGGSVFKYKRDVGSGVGASLTLNGPVYTRNVSPYRPVIFTGVDDNSVGESMDGYTGADYTGSLAPGGYAEPALKMTSGCSTLTLANCSFRYCRKAIQYWATSIAGINLNLSHVQLVKCIRGIELTSGGTGSGSGSGSGSGTGSGSLLVNINNGLFSDVWYPFTSQLGNNKYFQLRHCTFDQAAKLLDGTTVTYSYIQSTNSIYANITNTSSGNHQGDLNAFYNSAHLFGYERIAPPVFPFQTAGGGKYYLAGAANLRNAGLAMPAWLTVDLCKLTTYPPVVAEPGTITTDVTLGQQAPPDADALDVGYHYPKLDFLISGTHVDGAKLTLAPGTALGLHGASDDYGALVLDNGATLQSHGYPTRLNRLVWFNTVQESPPVDWALGNHPVSIAFSNVTSAGVSIDCRFTEFSRLGDGGDHIGAGYAGARGTIKLNDTYFNGGATRFHESGNGLSVALTNCLFARTIFECADGAQGMTLEAHNSLFWNNEIILDPVSANSTFSFYDNFFCTNTVTKSANAVVVHKYNAYMQNQPNLGTPSQGEFQLVPPFTFQAGPLGDWYQPGSLTDYGSALNSALIGLFHHTSVTTPGSREENSRLDVGLHYICTGTGGLPADEDWDNIPDYLEDFNENGNADFLLGETDWQDSENNTTGVAGLQVFTPLK